MPVLSIDPQATHAVRREFTCVCQENWMAPACAVFKNVDVI